MGRARRLEGKLPPQVMVYLALALLVDVIEEVPARLTETSASWGCRNDSWSLAASGGVIPAGQRFGPEPLELLYSKVAESAVGLLIHRVFLSRRRPETCPCCICSTDGA